VALPAAGCVVVGPNGHGKTSLLEALLYGEVFRSFRGAADRELVRFGGDGFHVRVAVDGGSAGGRASGSVVSVGYDARTREKRVLVDGVAPERMADAIGVVRGVVVSPGDVILVQDGPRQRRRYLDVLLSLTVPGYLEALTRYRRALQHRLRATAAETPVWEQLLATTGAAIGAARATWAERWAPAYAAWCMTVGEVEQEPRLTYAPRTEPTVDALLAALERHRERDTVLGHTTVGPHRDDVRLQLGGRDLRAYGSAGQQRTAALALRLVEAASLRAATGEAPVVGLDDAFAELDAARSHQLAGLVEQLAADGSQVIAAVPKAQDVPEAISSLPRWAVREGRIEDGG
jgi:DNA replication and repair protein RecF